MADVKQPIDNGVPTILGLNKTSYGVTVKTITPAVFLTSQYNSKPQAKADELTRLMNSLLSVGIWESKESAFYNGVAPGTFILVDKSVNGDIAARESRSISVEIVPFIKNKK